MLITVNNFCQESFIPLRSISWNMYSSMKCTIHYHNMITGSRNFFTKYTNVDCEGNRKVAFTKRMTKLFQLNSRHAMISFPLLSYFSVVVCLRWLYYHILSSITYIYIPGTLGPCFHYWCSVYSICNWSDTLWPVGPVRLFADYTISISSLCRPIWRHWTTKMLVGYVLPSVCLRLRQFSPLSFIQYMGLCVFSLPNSPVMIMIICTLSYYHHQTGRMND